LVGDLGKEDAYAPEEDCWEVCPYHVRPVYSSVEKDMMLCQELQLDERS
jgi:hypothetical protein